MDQTTKTNFKLALEAAIIARWNSNRAAGLVADLIPSAGSEYKKRDSYSPLTTLPATLPIWKMLGGEEKASRKLEALIGDTTTAGYLQNRNAIIHQLIQTVTEVKTPKGDTKRTNIEVAAGDFDTILTRAVVGGSLPDQGFDPGDPNYTTILDTLTSERVKELVNSGIGTQIQGADEDGRFGIDISQNVTATAAAATTNSNLPTGSIDTESPGTDDDFDPGDPNLQTQDDFFQYNPPTGADKKDPDEVGLPNGVKQSDILRILETLQKIDADPESQNLFDAWYTWYKQFYADKFDERYEVTLDGELQTISGATAAMWTALAAADTKIRGAASLPTDQKLEGNRFVEKPTPNTIRVNFMEKTADGATTPRTVDITLTDAGSRSAASLFDLLSKSKLVGQLGDIDGTDRVINLHAGSWWDLKDALRNPDMLGLSDVDTDDLAALYVQLNGNVEQYNPFNPRESQLPALSAELIKTGIAYSLDPITKTPTLVDTMPWIGPSPASLTFIPKDPNDPGGPGSWRIDESIELSIGKSLQEGVPASVRPWLQAVLNAGGDMSIIDSAFPSVIQGIQVSQTDQFLNLTPDEQLNIRQRDMLKHWVGYVLGQARLASDPRYAKQPVSIPMGLGQPPLNISSFDIAMPQWVNTTEGGMDYGLGARAGIAVGAADILAAGSTWLEQYNKMDSLGQIGAGQKYGSYPPGYMDAAGSGAGTATIQGTKVDSALQAAKDSAAASRQKAREQTAEQKAQAAFAAATAGAGLNDDIGSGVGAPRGGDDALRDRWRAWLAEGNTGYPHFINPLEWNLDMTRKASRQWVYSVDGTTIIGYHTVSSDGLAMMVPSDAFGNQIGPPVPHTSHYGSLKRYWMSNRSGNEYAKQGFYNFITSNKEFQNDPANGYEIDADGNVTLTINGESKTYDKTGALVVADSKNYDNDGNELIDNEDGSTTIVYNTGPYKGKSKTTDAQGNVTWKDATGESIDDPTKDTTTKVITKRVINANGTVTVTYDDGTTEEFPDVASTPAAPAGVTTTTAAAATEAGATGEPGPAEVSFDENATVTGSTENPDGSLTITWSNGYTMTTAADDLASIQDETSITPDKPVKPAQWAGDTQSSAGGIPISNIGGNTQNIYPGTAPPPELVGDANAARLAAARATRRAANAKAEDKFIEQQWNDFLASNTGDPGGTSFVQKAQLWEDFKNKGPQLSSGAKGVYTGQTVKGALQDEEDRKAFEAYEGATAGSTSATAGTNIQARNKRNKAGQDTTNDVIESEYY
tara:strand:- start:1172 stop:4963 length:3792 start_codon:yes stop_codon:yes gene_type:complete